MSWQPLQAFRDPSVPKLDNLRRAAAAGLRVPPTWWAHAAIAPPAGPPPGLPGGPVIVRSGSPTEDRRTTSNAGQLLSLVVRQRPDFGEALRRVVAALPRDDKGRPRGAVFVQPLVQAEEAGVAFFDGFYYERTLAAGGNEDLTSGQARGRVRRGHLLRGDGWSAWLTRVYAVFGRDRRLDIEFARDGEGLVLLQVRPALFPVRRNETLTLANHKETLGELPSPWTVSALVEAGHDLSFLEGIDPAIGTWGEGYAVELAGRAWMNLSFWFRAFDHVGFPRSFATQGIGGDQGGPEDRRMLWGAFFRRLPSAGRAAWLSWQKARQAEPGLRRLEERIARARNLLDLYEASVAGLVLALHINFAVAGLWSLVARLRAALGLHADARPVTQEMMEEYGRLATLPDPAARAAALDGWLARFGHRGPMESDLARPRFAELRPVLLHDLEGAARAPAPAPAAAAGRRGLLAWLARPLSRLDARREWFRDAMMRRWQALRGRILEEGTRLVAAGALDRAEDVFWLHGRDLRGSLPLRQPVAAARARAEQVRDLDLPLTAAREEVEALVERVGVERAVQAGRRVFPGIALGPAVVEGPALKADDLTDLLAGSAGRPLTGDAILVVPSLEPSWAVVFPRVAGVVAEVGGELSHASILLREARKPAVVNCAGIFRQIKSGDRLRLDGARGLVELVDGTP